MKLAQYNPVSGKEELLLIANLLTKAGMENKIRVNESFINSDGEDIHFVSFGRLTLAEVEKTHKSYEYAEQNEDSYMPALENDLTAEDIRAIRNDENNEFYSERDDYYIVVVMNNDNYQNISGLQLFLRKGLIYTLVQTKEHVENFGVFQTKAENASIAAKRYMRECA